MNQSQAIHPNLLPKDLEGVTQTNTYTEKPYSYFDPTHEQVNAQNTYQKVHVVDQAKKFLQAQKTLTKVKSMPLTLHNQLSDAYHAKSGDNLEIKKPSNLGETANRLMKEQKHAQFANFSPILNRAKSYELNRSFNTNLESKEYIVHDFTLNRTPKVNNYDKFNVKGSSGYIDPVTFESSLQEKSKQNISPVQQERPIKFNQSQAKNWQAFKVPVPNVRIPSNQKQSQNIQSPFSRNVSLPPTFQAKKTQVIFQKPQSVTYNSQQIIKSNITGLNQKVQLQSIVYDPANQSQISNMNSRREKISFAKIPLNTQRLEEVEFQRPQFRKVYDNKDETFRTVGPQQDYYKQEKTTCSKILPILGAIIFLVLLAGTIFGLGVMTGMIGSKNYLAGNEMKILEKEKQAFTTSDNAYVSNEVETGEYELTRQNEMKDEVAVPAVVPVVIEKTQQKTPEEGEKQIIKKEEVSTTQNLVPQQVKQVDILPAPVIIPTTTIQSPSEKTSEVITPVITPETVQPKKQTVPSIENSIEPQIINLPVKSVTQSKSEPINNVVQPQKAAQIQPTLIPTVQATSEQPATQPQKTTQQLTQELFQPAMIPTQTQKTFIKPESTPVQMLPITIPSELDNQETKPVAPEQQKITTEPITLQQAGKIVDVIIEENHEIIPVNVKSPLKKEILDEFEQVPLNFRDVSHVQKISYQHLQQIVKSDPSHKVTLKSINYRHHEVQKI